MEKLGLIYGFGINGEISRKLIQHRIIGDIRKLIQGGHLSTTTEQLMEREMARMCLKIDALEINMEFIGQLIQGGIPADIIDELIRGGHLSKKVDPAAQILPTEVLMLRESSMGPVRRMIDDLGINPDILSLLIRHRIQPDIIRQLIRDGLESDLKHESEMAFGEYFAAVYDRMNIPQPPVSSHTLMLTWAFVKLINQRKKHEVPKAAATYSNVMVLNMQDPIPEPAANYDGGVDATLSDQEPASPAVNHGELRTGGLQHYYRGVVPWHEIGIEFAANDQDSSSAAINGGRSTTYVRASDQYDYNFGDVRRGNGQVHLHMTSIVNMDGRVYNFTQEPRLNPPRSSQLINKIMLAITGQTAIALTGVAQNYRGSHFPPGFYFVVAANVVGFFTSMISVLLRNRKPRAAGVLARVGAVAGSSAIILAMGIALHMRYIWAFVFLCIMTAVAVRFGQT